MDAVQQALRKIIDTEGSAIIDDKRRVDAFLHDYYGDKHREIRILTTALEENIPRDLLNTSSQVPMEMVLLKLTQRLEDNCGYTEEASRWAIESWAYALGIPLSPSPSGAARDPQQQGAKRDLISIRLAEGLPLELVRIPVGEFVMGSDKRIDRAASDFEQPQTKVSLPEYWIGRYPVTVAQFAAFVQACGYVTAAEKVRDGYTWRTPQGKGSELKTKASHPVTYVTWYTARAFCDWLTEQMQTAARPTGSPTAYLLAARLPNEAEWEKAARGTDGRLYPWGSQAPAANLCNFNNLVGDTTPVGRYSPGGDSPYRVADMAGSVWEWTSSLWGKDWAKPEFAYPYRPDDGRENLGAPEEFFRVVRGGSFSYESSSMRCACRNWYAPHLFSWLCGFRVMVTLSLS
jgi:formylglycine-generating enzyme required for sulfatase activity